MEKMLDEYKKLDSEEFFSYDYVCKKHRIKQVSTTFAELRDLTHVVLILGKTLEDRADLDDGKLNE